MGASVLLNEGTSHQKGCVEIGRRAAIRKRVDRTICSPGKVRYGRQAGNGKTIFHVDPRTGLSKRCYVDNKSSAGRRRLQFDESGTCYQCCFYECASKRYWCPRGNFF